MLTTTTGFLCIQVETMTKENMKKKIAVKRPRDHDDSAAIQVFEVQIHCLTLILFYLSQIKKTFDTFFVSRQQQNKNEKKNKKGLKHWREKNKVTKFSRA